MVIFLPHFVALDAAWAAVALRAPRASTTIYTNQSNKLVDRWILRGRQRFGNLRLFGRSDGVKPIIGALRDGQPLYLLPDMDLGADDALFIPFFSVSAATVPSLSRFARMGGAQVLSMVSTVQAHGYNIHVSPVWADFPTTDFFADTRRMNAELEQLIHLYGVAQYYWVHKRFKTRPAGQPAFYD